MNFFLSDDFGKNHQKMIEKVIFYRGHVIKSSHIYCGTIPTMVMGVLRKTMTSKRR